MSYSEISQTTEYYEDSDKRRARKWKEIKHFAEMIKLPEHSHGVVENALWKIGNVNLEQFIMALMHEFDFTCMEQHLRLLYLSMEGGAVGRVDWRDLTSSLHILGFFRLIRDSPIELLLIIFDVYATPIDVTPSMQKTKSFESIANSNYIDDSSVLLRIFLLPTILSSEVKVISDFFDQAIFEYFNNNVFEKIPKVTKRIFKMFLSSKLEFTDKLVSKWKTLCWNLIPTVHRLIVYDESQLACMHNADVITDKYKWREACLCYDKKLIK